MNVQNQDIVPIHPALLGQHISNHDVVSLFYIFESLDFQHLLPVEKERVKEIMLSLFNGLPPHRQKDIEELKFYCNVLEENK